MSGFLNSAHIAKILDIMLQIIVGCSLRKVVRLIKKELIKEIKAINQRSLKSKQERYDKQKITLLA
jgi:hypothetical protein